MKRRRFLQQTTAALLSLRLSPAASSAKNRALPNIVFILADDLGYGDIGCYGQDKIKTPHLDRMAAEGMRFTQFYSGQTVCAPSRCVLMTGKHTGHSFIRTNREVQPEGQLPIPESTWTLGKMLKAQGYMTAAIGKWGLGPVGSSGDPNQQGFDLFFGYNCQRQAHNYYPRYLYRNSERIPLEGNDEGLTGEQYAPDLMIEEALHFIRQNQDRPFFLYFPTTVPHLALQVPEDSLEEYKETWPDSPYDGKKGYLPHPSPRAAYAAMITRMDRDIGRIMNLLQELHLDENTLVIFTSDNGPTANAGLDTDFFDSNGPLREKKGSLSEGGIRVPAIARWPGRIRAGSVSDRVGAFWDFMPTFAELSGGNVGGPIDGISIASSLFGQPELKEHDYLYWEYPTSGGQQAVRMADWKGIRRNLMRKEGDRSLQLYNLKEDIGEQNNVADKYPEIVQKIQEIMQNARTPSKEFPFPALDG